MQNLLAFFLVLSSLFLINCQSKETPKTNLIINLAGTGPDKLDVFHIGKEIHHQVTAQKDSLALDLKEATILDLTQRRDHHYVYVTPNSTLNIDTLSVPELMLGIRENPSKENQYLVDFATLIAAQSTEFFTPDMSKKGVDSFLLLVQQKYKPLDKLVAQIKKEEMVSPSFKKALVYRLVANRGNDLLTYNNMYNYWHKAHPELPNGFYSELEALDFSDPSLMIFEEGRRLGLSWNNKDISYNDYNSVSAYYAACLANMDKTNPASLLRDYCFFDMVDSDVNFGGGIDGADSMITVFKETVSNKYLNNKLDETIEPWLTLKAGLDAPNFIAKKRDDVEVPLSDLKGKRVYIDVWATWCGPCIREIPALKKLEAELHDENIEFVSISIDEAKDKEKWLTFIEEKALTGLQLMAENDWKSDIATAYNIKGIPRFLLIDEAGKIISANAPRPSSPDIKEVLLN